MPPCLCLAKDLQAPGAQHLFIALVQQLDPRHIGARFCIGRYATVFLHRTGPGVVGGRCQGNVAVILLEQARQAQGLRVGLAQSIERELSPEESSHHKGRQQSQAQWAWLARELSSQPHFSGVIVQSLAEYQKAKP